MDHAPRRRTGLVLDRHRRRGSQVDLRRRKARLCWSREARRASPHDEGSRATRSRYRGDRQELAWATRMLAGEPVSVTLVGDTGDQLREKSRLQKASHWPFSLR